jgi:hypothetical protein
MAGFTFDKPATQEIVVTGNSDGRDIQFVGVFHTYTEEDLKGIYKELEEALDGANFTQNHSALYELADRLMIGWVNRQTDDASWWVTESDGVTPLECTPELKAQMLGQGCVAACIAAAFYQARQTPQARLGNSPTSPSRGFASAVRAASPPS